VIIEHDQKIVNKRERKHRSGNRERTTRETDNIGYTRHMTKIKKQKQKQNHMTHSWEKYVLVFVRTLEIVNTFSYEN